MEILIDKLGGVVPILWVSHPAPRWARKLINPHLYPQSGVLCISLAAVQSAV